MARCHILFFFSFSLANELIQVTFKHFNLQVANSHQTFLIKVFLKIKSLKKKKKKKWLVGREALIASNHRSG